MLNGNIGDPADVQHLGHKASDTAAPSKDDMPRQATTGFGHDGFIQRCRPGGAKVGKPGQIPFTGSAGVPAPCSETVTKTTCPMSAGTSAAASADDQQKGEFAGMGQDETCAATRMHSRPDPRRSEDDGRLQGTREARAATTEAGG